MSDLLAHFTAWKADAQHAQSARFEPNSQVQPAPSPFETELNNTAQSEKKEGESFSAWDLLDLINPLQHMPLVSDYYRSQTGDTIRPEIQLAGSAAIGGVVGFAAQLGKMVFEAGTGQTVETALVAALTDTTNPPQPEPQPAARELVQAAPVVPVTASTPPAIAAHIIASEAKPYPDVRRAFGQPLNPAYRAYPSPSLEDRQNLGVL